MKFRFEDPSIKNPPVIEEIVEIPDDELEGLEGAEWLEAVRVHFHKWVIEHGRASYQRVFDKENI